ncbi:hypothetical protein E4U55_004505 [Claviceps digitariae]|nr:hypothetical protein E4U55_004505 [Claviceps digitariae]
MAADWFQKGREALFEALSGVCDQIETGLREDQLAQASESQATILAQLEVIEKLRAENEAMRGQLAKLQSLSTTSTEIDPPSTIKNDLPRQHTVPPSLPTVTSVPKESLPATGVGCRGDCSKVLRRYHAIAANFKKAKDALERRKMERIKWARHTEYLNAKLREAEEQHGIQILDQEAPRIDVPSATAIDAEEGVFDHALSFISDDGSPAAEPELPVLLSKPPPHGETTLAPNTSSQTTQGQASDATSQSPTANALHGDTGIKQEPSSDTPEIVTERKVKKRKRADEEVDAVVKPLVKSEPDGGSSPIMSIPPAKLCTQESLDLGDIVQKVQTPRKRRFLEQSEPQTEMTSRFKLGAVTPLSAPVPRYSHSAKIQRQNSALMPLDGNIRLIRPKHVKRGAKDRRRELAISIAELADDCALGEAIQPTKATEESTSKSAKSRLGNLLDGRTEETDVFTELTPTRNKPVTPAREPAIRVPKRRQLPFDNSEDRDGKTMHATRTMAMYNNSEVRSRAWIPMYQRQSTGTLRNKPPSELQLSDFKINPSANEGHDFAFSEVVRDRTDRSCLPGCIDMHCCGKQFRALAISQRPDPPLTFAQRLEEQKLLENYLGDSSYHLATMDKEERMELWIKAKTQELANKYGKHRHRFSRMQSPPGFWDADFPNTQQLEADRQEAIERTKRAIAERYREALRPGGRWKFADE